MFGKGQKTQTDLSFSVLAQLSDVIANNPNPTNTTSFTLVACFEAGDFRCWAYQPISGNYTVLAFAAPGFNATWLADATAIFSPFNTFVEGFVNQPVIMTGREAGGAFSEFFAQRLQQPSVTFVSPEIESLLLSQVFATQLGRPFSPERTNIVRVRKHDSDPELPYSDRFTYYNSGNVSTAIVQAFGQHFKPQNVSRLLLNNPPPIHFIGNGVIVVADGSLAHVNGSGIFNVELGSDTNLIIEGDSPGGNLTFDGDPFSGFSVKDFDYDDEEVVLETNTTPPTTATSLIDNRISLYAPDANISVQFPLTQARGLTHFDYNDPDIVLDPNGRQRFGITNKFLLVPNTDDFGARVVFYDPTGRFTTPQLLLVLTDTIVDADIREDGAGRLVVAAYDPGKECITLKTYEGTIPVNTTTITPPELYVDESLHLFSFDDKLVVLFRTNINPGVAVPVTRLNFFDAKHKPLLSGPLAFPGASANDVFFMATQIGFPNGIQKILYSSTSAGSLLASAVDAYLINVHVDDDADDYDNRRLTLSTITAGTNPANIGVGSTGPHAAVAIRSDSGSHIFTYYADGNLASNYIPAPGPLLFGGQIFVEPVGSNHMFGYPNENNELHFVLRAPDHTPLFTTAPIAGTLADGLPSIAKNAVNTLLMATENFDGDPSAQVLNVHNAVRFVELALNPGAVDSQVPQPTPGVIPPSQ